MDKCGGGEFGRMSVAIGNIRLTNTYLDVSAYQDTTPNVLQAGAVSLCWTSG